MPLMRANLRQMLADIALGSRSNSSTSTETNISSENEDSVILENSESHKSISVRGITKLMSIASKGV